MNEDLKEEWIKRLTSGDYEQGQDQLRTMFEDDQGQETGEAKYCCLGVLCDVLKDKGLGEWNRRGFTPDNTVFKVEYESDGYDLEGDLNRPVLAYVGLHDSDQQTLINMNDHHENSFDEIAEFIAVEF